LTRDIRVFHLQVVVGMKRRLLSDAFTAAARHNCQGATCCGVQEEAGTPGASSARVSPTSWVAAIKAKRRKKTCERVDAGKPCSSGSTDYCEAHGGGRRCAHSEVANGETCGSSAAGKTEFCKTHGGGASLRARGRGQRQALREQRRRQDGVLHRPRRGSALRAHR
jgi:hypothetical protein